MRIRFFLLLQLLLLLLGQFNLKSFMFLFFFLLSLLLFSFLLLLNPENLLLRDELIEVASIIKRLLPSERGTEANIILLHWSPKLPTLFNPWIASQSWTKDLVIIIARMPVLAL
jgi:hypothetical protein